MCVKCRRCRAPALIDVRRHNAAFCADCFTHHCREQVRRAIDDFDMVQPGERILVAVSGGKDSLGLWHLPSEKGLSLRRTAQDMVRGRQERVRVEMLDPVQMGRRFKVAGTGPARQLKDDLWLARQRVTEQIRTRLAARSS